VLDAKNQLVAPLTRDWLEAPDGRIRVVVNSYESHPHRPGLEAACRYLGLDAGAHVGGFTATVPPFTMETATVRGLVAELGRRSGRGFAAEFLAHDFTEFLLYGAWVLARDGRLEEHFAPHERTWPVVWPSAATRAGVEAAVERAGDDVPLFAVHRKALAALDPDAVLPLARFWTERGLFASEEEAARFVARFRRLHRRRLRLHQLREAPRTVRLPRGRR
jgi:hypothetical protein